MNSGTKYKAGDVILLQMQFSDSFKVKTRPGVILFEEFGNLVVAGITSNTNMQGITLTKKDGMIKNSVIKLNYIFTTTKQLVKKKLITLKQKKKEEIYSQLSTYTKQLIFAK